MSENHTSSLLTRRQFINRGISSMAIVSLMPSLLRNTANAETGIVTLRAVLHDLPYSYGALEPYIDGRTMQIHHDLHHAGYIRKLNAALEKWMDCPFDTLESVFGGMDAVPEDIVTSIRNNGGGTWNHSLFWECLSPETGQQPGEALLAAINTSFGSFDAMKDMFSDAAATRFGSGWAWLCVDKQAGLFVSSTPNQDNPMMSSLVERWGVPILGLDVWEHAYYLHYQNRRKDYIDAFWNIVNWKAVDERYRKAIADLPPQGTVVASAML